MRRRCASKLSRRSCARDEQMSAQALRVSLVQQPLIWHDPAANRARFSELLAPLAGHTDLVVLPETFTTGFSMEVELLGEVAGGATLEWLKGQAAALGAVVT